MYATSFRILVGVVHGKKIYVNGAFQSVSVFEPGIIVYVMGNHAKTGKSFPAEVITCQDSTREVSSFDWKLV